MTIHQTGKLFTRIGAFLLLFLASAHALGPVFWQEREHVMLPKWAYGYWQVGFAPVPADNAADILKLAQEHRDSDHPGDVWILDLGAWNCAPVDGFGGWDSEDWCAGKFDDPKGFIQQMNDMNWHIGMNYHPWGHQSPNPVDAYKNVLLRDAEFGSEIPWIDIRSNDPIWWMWDALDGYWKNKGNKRTMMLNYLGSFTYGDLDQDHEWDLGHDAAFPAYWSGDTEPSWRSFHDQIKRITHDGAWKGLYTLHMDTPGHFGLDMKTYSEMTARTVQFSDFSPLVQQHGQGGRLVKDATPQVQEIMTFSRKLRYRLMPYIYTYNWEMWEKALPITRPMDMVFPNDNDVAEKYQQYMFGENFLVAPVTTDRHNDNKEAIDFGSSTMSITFPEGETWIDYWSHEVYEGGTTIDYDVSDWMYIPLFVKKGAITPMGPDIKFIDLAKHPDPLTLDIYPADEGNEVTFTMYDDDGDTYAYQEGKGATTLFTATTEQHAVSIMIGADKGDYTGKPTSRNYIVKLNMQQSKATQVLVNNTEISEAPSLESILEGAVESGWAFDSEHNTAYIRLKANTNSQSSITYIINDAQSTDNESSRDQSSTESSTDHTKISSTSQSSNNTEFSSSSFESNNSTSSESHGDASSENRSPLITPSLLGSSHSAVITHFGKGQQITQAPSNALTFSLFTIQGELIIQNHTIVEGRATIPASAPQGVLFIRFQ